MPVAFVAGAFVAGAFVMPSFWMHYGICSQEKDECYLATFHFPCRKEEVLSRWIKFVGKNDWAPTTRMFSAKSTSEKNS